MGPDICLEGTRELWKVLEVKAENLGCAGDGVLGPRRRDAFRSHLKSKTEMRRLLGEGVRGQEGNRASLESLHSLLDPHLLPSSGTTALASPAPALTPGTGSVCPALSPQLGYF